MPSSKKYTLYSASSAPAGETPLCAFFSSPAGCRNGDSCKFLHSATKSAGNVVESKQDCSVEVSEHSSVVSSESEGGNENPTSVNNSKNHVAKGNFDDPFADSPAPPSDFKKKKDNVNDQNPKKKKRKSSDGDLFAVPKSKAPKMVNSSLQKNETPQKRSKKQHIQPALQSSDFRSFVSSLPVASFSIPDSKSTPAPVQHPEHVANSSPRNGLKNPPSASKKEENHAHAGRTLPTSSEVARKWNKAVTKTRQHERYDIAYDFVRYKENDAQNGINVEWLKAKPYGPWCKSHPQAIAIDCEMCETQDPLSGAKNPKALCRISVVNAEKPQEVLLDTLVRPSWPVIDYRTRINGVTKEHLDSVEFTLRHAQAFMMALCSEETVIVGHAVHNDLAAINMEHEVVVDSSFLYRAKDSTHATVSLKDVVKAVMNTDMPETHDSVNDARKALECVLHWVKKEGKVDLIERSPKHSHYKSNQLFVHRIPKQCKTEHLTNMFLKHTTIQPVDVDEILFSGNTGKTHVNFRSPAHANLAFDSIEGNAEEDLSGRLQKKVYLRNGDYVRVRKVVHVAKRVSLSDATSSKQEGEI
jgi:RNA exonuclease 1